MRISLRQLDPQAQALFISDITEAVDVLRDGGIILYPTDTIWGIGCDATNVGAVKKIFALKRRDDSKALITLVPSDTWIERYVEEVPEIAWELMEAAVDPLTIVYDKGKNLAPNLYAPDGSIGIRVTHELFSSELCKRLKVPVVSTSANVSGLVAPSSFSEISQEIISGVDYVCRWNRQSSVINRPSGVIKISAGGVFKILR